MFHSLAHAFIPDRSETPTGWCELWKVSGGTEVDGISTVWVFTHVQNNHVAFCSFPPFFFCSFH